MISMPNSTHFLIDSLERAWAATRRWRRFASLTAMAISSSENWFSSAPMPVISSPVRLILIVSTPHFISWRTLRRMSSGPETTIPRFRPSWGMCGSEASPRPPTAVISGPAAV